MWMMFIFTFNIMAREVNLARVGAKHVYRSGRAFHAIMVAHQRRGGGAGVRSSLRPRLHAAAIQAHLFEGIARSPAFGHPALLRR